MVDGWASSQPAPWRSRHQQNRTTGSEDTVPTATIKLGGGVSITLNGATTNQISNILDRATATRHAIEADSSRDSTTTTQIGHQTIKNAKRRGRRQATAAAKAAAAGESGAETTSTVEEHDGRYNTVAPPQQDQHGHTTEDEPATAQDTDVYQEAEAPDAQKQLARDKNTQAEGEGEQDEEEAEEEEAKAQQTEVAEDRLASEEPETETETGEEALKVLRDLQSCTEAAGQRMAGADGRDGEDLGRCCHTHQSYRQAKHIFLLLQQNGEHGQW